MEIDPETRLLAILHLATEAQPGPDGMLPPEVQQAIKTLGAPQGALPPVQGKFSLEEEELPCYEECFGTEAPGPGWVYTGEMRWVRGVRRKKPDLANLLGEEQANE